MQAAQPSALRKESSCHSILCITSKEASCSIFVASDVTATKPLALALNRLDNARFLQALRPIYSTSLAVPRIWRSSTQQAWTRPALGCRSQQAVLLVLRHLCLQQRALARSSRTMCMPASPCRRRRSALGSGGGSRFAQREKQGTL